jgi:sec-independent protein translocase protein TatA
MFDLSAIQIIIVLVIALVVFGPKRLPELGRQLGKGLREMKGQATALSDEFRDATPESPRSAPATAEPEVVTAAAGDADDALLDGVVVSGASGPEPPRPTDAS